MLPDKREAVELFHIRLNWRPTPNQRVSNAVRVILALIYVKKKVKR